MKLPLDCQIILLNKMTAEYNDYIEMGLNSCPKENVYVITSLAEDSSIKRIARTAAIKEFEEKSIFKYAFDTRRVDQENTRNPRQNLQYWHRSEAFLEQEDEDKLKVFANLMTVLTNIKNDFDKSTEWFQSYARILYDNVYRILRIKQADLDIFKPQLSYLEQLIFARYRMSMEDLVKLNNNEIKERILSKDEQLLKRGNYLNETGIKKDSADKIVIDGNKGNTQESIVQALFGNNGIRRDGERTVERTITITVRDSVID